MRIASIIVTTSLMSSLALGCDVESVDGFDSSAEELSITPRAGTSEALAEAMDTVDLIVQGLTSVPDPEIPWLLGNLQDLALGIDYQALSPAEIQQLDVYVKSKSAEVLPIFTILNDAGIPVDGFADPFIPDGLCTSHCVIIFRFSCEEGTYLGLCLGGLPCGDPANVPHECGLPNAQLPDDSCGGETCGVGERCAEWLFKPNECVETCESNADCSGGEKCKKPFGTSFKRCK